jgi:hypothetical protein
MNPTFTQTSPNQNKAISESLELTTDNLVIVVLKFGVEECLLRGINSMFGIL